MSNYDELDYETPQNRENEPEWLQKLRSDSRQLSSIRKKLPEGAKLEDVIDGYFKLSAEQRTQSLASLLASKGVNPKAAKYFPKDLDPTEDNLAKWLEEDGDVFAPVGTEAQPPAEEAPETETPQADPVPEWAQQFQRIQQQDASGDTVQPTKQTETAATLAQAFENAKSSQDFINFLRTNGAV